MDSVILYRAKSGWAITSLAAGTDTDRLLQ
jgi:hypothetical protein